MRSLIYFYGWVICPHAVLSFAKDHAGAGSSNVYRHLEGINSGVFHDDGVPHIIFLESFNF
jgi:hypothetical protein